MASKTNKSQRERHLQDQEALATTPRQRQTYQCLLDLRRHLRLPNPEVLHPAFVEVLEVTLRPEEISKAVDVVVLTEARGVVAEAAAGRHLRLMLANSPMFLQDLHPALATHSSRHRHSDKAQVFPATHFHGLLVSARDLEPCLRAPEPTWRMVRPSTTMVDRL